MKQNKRIFNQLLYSYQRSIRRLSNLRKENRNLRRQGIIEKRIEKLFTRLTELKARIQKLSIAGVLAASAFTFMGNDAKAQFPTFDTKQVNPFGLSGGYFSNPKPEFVDLDGDGDYDVVAMFSGYYGPNEFRYFENTGTNIAPNYTTPVTNPFGLSNYHYSLGMYYDNFSFDFVDLDGDGDFDVVAKRRGSSTFYYFENSGTATAPAFGTPVTLPLFYSYTAEEHPHFVDLDDDGDFDMITGITYSYFYSSNSFIYRENTGSFNSPDFSTSPLQFNPFGLSGAPNRPTPEMVDIDNDGDFDLMSGADYYTTGFVFYENTGTNLSPSFGTPQNLPFDLTTSYYDSRTNPTMVDLDNDGDIDLLSGNNYGQFIYYKNNGICFPTSSTISPNAACNYISPLGNIYTTNGTYIETINNVAGCDSTITINLTINPIADQSFTAIPSTVCSGGSSFINIGSSDNAIQYYLRDDANNNIVAGPVVGDGNAIAINTGNLTSATTFNVLAVGSFGDQGMVFGGGKVDCGNNSNIQLSGNAITLEAWIYPTSWQANVWEGNIINKEACCPDQGYMLRCGDNGRLNFNIGSGSWNEISSAQNALTLNTWQHVAGVYDGSTMSIYVDGNLVGSQSTSVSFFSNNENLAIGNWSPNNGRPFIGKIDDVRIWSVSKTQTDIQNDMSSCLSGSETGLAAYYQFANLPGSTIVTDLSGNGNNGTLDNMDENTSWVSGYGNCMDCSLELTGTVTVDVAQPTTSTIAPTSCFTYTAPSGAIYNASGTYTDIITNNAGCDSTITINLTINTVNVNVTDNNPTFTAQSTGTYQWINCTTNTSINGETTQSFTATSNGSYAVEVTENGCTDTSSCFVVSTVGVNENSFDIINIYPNPTNGIININIMNAQPIFNYEITSIDGKIIRSISNLNNKVLSLDISNEANGIYFLRLIGNNETKLVKIVKQ